MARLEEMPNGEVVEVPDDITPEALNRIKQQNRPTRQQRVAQGQPRVSPERAAVLKEADRRSNYTDSFGRHSMQRGMMDSVMQGITFGTMDEIGAGLMASTQGVYRAIRDGDMGQIGKTYRFERDLDRELQRRYEDSSPIGSTVGEITGAVVNPIGTGAKGLQMAGRGLEAVGASRLGGAAVRGGERLAAAGAVPQGIAAGTLQGSLNAAGHAEEIGDVPGALVQGGVLGGLTGGALGGVTHAGARGIQILRDASAANAERTAYSRIAQLLENGGTNARRVQREIAVTDARGGDAVVGDMTPGLRAQAGAISRKPAVPSSNELIERGEQRIQDRRARFGQQVRDTADVPPIGDDALARSDALAAGRKASGQSGYAPGGVMDTPITPTPALQKYLNEAPEEVQAAMRGAYREMLLRDEPGFANAVGPNGIFTHIPNLRTFDYLKRSFDTQIGQALRAGDKQTAQGLSYQLDKLKGVLADANPNDAAYKALLKSQRDAFQQQNANEIGQGVLRRLGSEPRLVLRDLKALEPHAVDDARVGIIDALINADNKADPVAYFRGIMRNDNQRKVMEFAFGGKGNLGRFERWVNREVRATRSDVLTAPGRQSETARFQMADAEEGAGVGTVLSNAMRGFAFGGTIGAGSGIVRTLQNIATGTTRLGQEQIAKILLSKGDDLVKGTEAAAAYQRARRVGNRNRARIMGKAGQQIYTDMAGGD